jgi:hypothetical protein
MKAIKTQKHIQITGTPQETHRRKNKQRNTAHNTTTREINKNKKEQNTHAHTHTKT